MATSTSLTLSRTPPWQKPLRSLISDIKTIKIQGAENIALAGLDGLALVRVVPGVGMVVDGDDCCAGMAGGETSPAGAFPSADLDHDTGFQRLGEAAQSIIIRVISVVLGGVLGQASVNEWDADAAT